MNRSVALFLVCLAILAAPSTLDAQCAKCTSSWFSGDSCNHCAGGQSCGESCKFDSYGNCYMPIACGVPGGVDVGLEEVLEDRGITEIPTALASTAGDLRVQEVGADLLVQWSCQGAPQQVWRVRDGRLVSLGTEDLDPAELTRAQRQRHLRLLLT